MRRFNSYTIPTTALASILWGFFFWVGGPERRSSGSFRAVSWLPLWVMGTLMVVTGALVLVTALPIAVGLLAGVWTFYALALTCNVFVTDTAALTGPVVVGLTATNLIIATHLRGVRKP